MEKKSIILKKQSMTPYKCAIIGAGIIASYYKPGIETSKYLKLIAVCDINPNCISRQLYSEYAFYKEYKTLAKKEDIDVAIISTNVDAHLEIAEFFLKSGKSVMIEKPVVLDLKSLYHIYELADKNKAKIFAMFHWKYADEVYYLKNHLKDFGKIKKIIVSIRDDYASNPANSIRKDRLGLSGAWFDSGINVLSYIDEIICMKDATEVFRNSNMDHSCQQDIYTKREYITADGIEIEIVVDWTKKSDKKQSLLFTEKGTVEVCHNQQRVFLNGELLFEKRVIDRLCSHYTNLFATQDFFQDRNTVLRLYKFLFA